MAFICFYFPFHIWVVILPIDELIFFKMVTAPPTRYPLVNMQHNYGKSPFFMGELTISMAIFNSKHSLFTRPGMASKFRAPLPKALESSHPGIVSYEDRPMVRPCL